VVPTPATYLFADEFAGAAGTAPDPSKWAYDTGEGIWGTGEVENMIESLETAYVDGAGHLVIALVSDGSGGYLGARLTTQGKFSSQVGTAWEASIKITPMAGAWPAFWLMGNNGNWPANGEVDVLENYGTANNGESQTTVHSSGGNGQPSAYANFAADSNFHIYRVEWTAGQFEFFRDGVSYLTVTSAKLTPWPFEDNGGMYVILNVAAGGSGTNSVNPAASALPVKMTVDYVHCWEL
jgi:beta-glucanase (GH16 family)